jgi:hypothetical protein
LKQQEQKKLEVLLNLELKVIQEEVVKFLVVVEELQEEVSLEEEVIRLEEVVNH